MVTASPSVYGIVVLSFAICDVDAVVNVSPVSRA
jgi:hypothetical protein